MSDRYGVMGYPLSHTLSPPIHRAFARATGQDVHYDAYPLSPEAGVAAQELTALFAAQAQAFFAAGGLGLNITAPFKAEALRLASALTARAQEVGVVNTLKKTPSGLLGDNTDGIGLLQDLERLQIDLAHRDVLVLGAGGAVQGIVPVLAKCQLRSLTIANRTLARAAQLCAQLGRADIRAAPIAWDDLDQGAWQIIVHGTSISTKGEQLTLPAALFAQARCAYDLAYDISADTPFVRAAREQGVTQVQDGLGMLVAQAAHSFALWRGVLPDPWPVLQQLRQHQLA